MQLFDNEKSKILKEFEKIDKYFNNFKIEFTAAANLLLLKYYPNFKPNENFSEVLDDYSKQILSIADSVIDKNNNYPAFRLEEELNTMNKLVLKTAAPKDNSRFAEDLGKSTRKLMVNYFPKIYDLSGNGFRLLETNTELFMRKILMELHAEILKYS